jgi:tRNA 2-thiouridine synthesizing protein A
LGLASQRLARQIATQYGFGYSDQSEPGARMQWDVELDCAGLLCPLPVLRARKRLIAMTPGAVLRVLATDAMAAIDLPHFCAQTGHEFLGASPAEGAIAYLIRCGSDKG